jgi:aryl-alcohol dehydrogenase-like predicted oxidoreductase
MRLSMTDPLPPPPALALERRPLGRTSIAVSPLGLAGSYGISADDAVRAFHELGINYFFVSPRMKGLAEATRRLIKEGHRDRLVIASGASIPTGGSVKKEWEKCADALGVEHIDVFHLFWVQAHWYVTGQTWNAMRALKEEGKARALGLSCHDRPMARALVDELGLDVLMIRYNAAHRGAEKEVFDSLPRNRPGIVAYTATRWGKLLKAVGPHRPMSAAECYRFALTHPSVDVVLSGAADYAELAANAAGVAAGPLGPARMDEVRAFGDTVRRTATGKVGFWGM